MTGFSRPWTDEELGFLQDHDDWTARRIGEALDRPAEGVQKKRRQLARGWSRTLEAWTDDEIAVLIEGRWATAEQLIERLPGRTVFAVNAQRKMIAAAASPTAGGGKLASSIGARPLIAKTCSKCGRILQAEWFAWVSRQRVWSSDCRLCAADRKRASGYRGTPNVEASRRSRENQQRITLPGATRRGQEWTESDHQVLADPDLTVLQKALKLNRTYNGAQVACSRYGYKSHVGLGEPTDLWRIFNPNEPDRVAA